MIGSSRFFALHRKSGGKTAALHRASLQIESRACNPVGYPPEKGDYAERGSLGSARCVVAVLAVTGVLAFRNHSQNSVLP
jgi:hypothetical protein